MLTIALLLVATATQAQHTEWLTNMDEAKAKAKAENKEILLSFSGSDWCGNCIRLEKDLFEQEAFKTFAGKEVILVRADFPMKKKNKLPADQTKHNEALAEKYNQKGAFPTVVVLSANGDKLGTMKHPAASANAYLANLKTLVK